MAIQSNFPAIRPTLDLNFASSRTVDPRITFTRASTATYFDEFGVMRTVPVNTPRIDFDPTTGECKGLLIEEQRTNLLPYSEQFDNTAWVKNSATISANATTAPDGTMTADKLVEDTAIGFHEISEAATLVVSTTYALSVYVKAAGRSRLRIAGRLSSSWSPFPEAYFDLSAGTVVSTTTTASIQSVGNGWYRCTLIGTTSGTNAGMSIGLVSTGTTSSYIGDGTSGIYIWGAQLEAGGFQTSYIPTTSAQATRANEGANMTGVNFSSWYRQDEGTFLAAYSRNSDKASGGQIPYTVSDGTDNNIITITDGANGTSDCVLITDNGVGQVNTGAINYTAGQLIIRSVGYKLNNVATSSNGAAVVTDYSVIIPAVNQLSIGFAPHFSSSRLNGHIRRFAYYPKRLSNTNLQALTT